MTGIIEAKSTITGTFAKSFDRRVTFRRLDGRTRWIITVGFALLTTILGLAYVAWLIVNGVLTGSFVNPNTIIVTAVIIALLTECVRVPLVFTLAWSSVLAKMPVLLRQRGSLDVALFVTFVPSSEDIQLLQELLIAAKRIKHSQGRYVIFVLDEGDKNDPDAVPRMIDSINRRYGGHPVYRLSRFGIQRYHQGHGKPFETKTKHGNINAAINQIATQPDKYGTFDIVMGLDPDHVPMESFAARMLGYFNDPDVAYVPGPQAYANARFFPVPKLAESQQFVFHTMLQMAANSFGAPMLVGTSYAVRWTALQQIGGIQPSITEDMATSFAILAKKNPCTGKNWKGVYTPDVLAHGEGPETWGAFFKQQDRWSRGAMEFMVAGPFIKRMFGMWRKPRAVLHYLMLMSFYPIMGISWLLAATGTTIIAITGENGGVVAPSQWVIFYSWAAITQIGLYTWTRQYNVSPYETSNSWGVFGMFMSVVSAPVYANSIIKTLFRRPVGFNVTPKGSQAQGDTWFVFRFNGLWAAFYAVAFSMIAWSQGFVFSLLAWPVVAFSLSIAPIVIWKWRRPVTDVVKASELAQQRSSLN